MEIWYNYETAIKIRHCDKIWRSAVHIIAHNFFRQFLNVTFNEIFCLLALFLFYGIRAKYIASGNSWWLLWPKCWLETEFDYRLRLRFSLLIQLILSRCVASTSLYLMQSAEPPAAIPFSTIFKFKTFKHFTLYLFQKIRSHDRRNKISPCLIYFFEIISVHAFSEVINV